MTELQKRGGMSEENYAKVNSLLSSVQRLRKFLYNKTMICGVDYQIIRMFTPPNFIHNEIKPNLNAHGVRF